MLYRTPTCYTELPQKKKVIINKHKNYQTYSALIPKSTHCTAMTPTHNVYSVLNCVLEVLLNKSSTKLPQKSPIFKINAPIVQEISCLNSSPSPANLSLT